MDRILQNVASTISVVFEVDGVATAPSPNTATVKVLSSDGSTLVAAGTPTVAGGVGEFKYTLTPANCALLDDLTAQWTATIGGVLETLTTSVQVVGGFLFSLAAARRRLPDATAYPTADLAQLRTRIEEELELACGVAFVPRYSVERHSVPSGPRLRLDWRHPRVLRTLSISGVAWGASQVALLDVAEGGWIDASQSWSWWSPLPGSPQALVGYEHGLDRPPSFMSAAGLDLAAFSASSSGGTIDPRATRIITQDGELALTAGGAGDSFGLPSVDRAVCRLAGAEVW